MGPFMAVIEKTDVLDVRSFAKRTAFSSEFLCSPRRAGKIDRFPPYPEKSLANRGE